MPTRTGFPLPEEAIARIGSARFRAEGYLAALRMRRTAKTIIAARRDGRMDLWDAEDGRVQQQMQVKASKRL